MRRSVTRPHERAHTHTHSALPEPTQPPKARHTGFFLPSHNCRSWCFGIQNNPGALHEAHVVIEAPCVSSVPMTSRCPLLPFCHTQDSVTRHAWTAIPLAGVDFSSGLAESNLGPPLEKNAAFARRPARAARPTFPAAREENRSILLHCGQQNQLQAHLQRACRSKIRLNPMSATPPKITASFMRPEQYLRIW